MKRNILLGILLATSMAAIFACARQPAPAAEAPPTGKPSPVAASVSGKTAWQDRWDRTLAAARQEGLVRIYGMLSAESRQALAKPFQERYGFEIEFLSGSGAELSQRFLSEQAAGINVADILIIGHETSLFDLKPKGVLQKVEPLLILPEVRDASAYLDGKLPFLDKGQTAIPLVAGVAPLVVVNTDMVGDSVKAY